MISFDTTYLTNKYDMPFALLVGVNHHGQSIILGCGSLSSEIIESYEWFFRIWLTRMAGRAPCAIITDQCSSIQKVVANTFPESEHHLRFWHIMNKVPKKLDHKPERDAVVPMSKGAVYDTMQEEEFELCW